jgi:PAS domain S-box-containing protein
MAQRPLPTILFVDDDSSNRLLMSWLFREAGYAVLEAATGEEALRLSQQKPDLVVLDVNLPDLTGFEVCRRIKAQPATRSVSVVHMSAVYVGSGDRSQGLEEGADAYLVKPVEPRELLATVRALLRIRAAEEAARAAAQEWRTTFDAIGDAVCLLAPNGHIRRCNRAMGELVHRDLPGLVDQPHDEVLRAGLGLAEAPRLAGLGAGLPRETQEVRLGERWFRVTADPIRDEQGSPTGSVHILTDVTRRKELEEQVRQSQRLEAIGRLAGGVAHHFNNLLTAIVGNASVLLRRLPEGEQDHELVVTIERAAWRAAELTRQLLGFSRQALLWLRPVDPGEIIDELTASLRRTLDERIELVVQREQGLWTTQADPGNLLQALMNLCLNATDAMPKGGRLTVAARNEQVNEAHAARHVEARVGPFVRVAVQDTGEGIPPEVLAHIFDPFSSTKQIGRGSGLGLAMVHGLIKQHQGWVECQSTPGEGSVFTVYLPRSSAEEAGSAPTPATVAAPAGRYLVLLADGDDTLRALAAAYLRQGGLQVLLAGDTGEAAEAYQAEHARIDLVILDQSLVQMEGPAALERMRAINPGVRVLFASSSAEEAGARPEGVLGFIPKPYRERELLQAVHAALGLM